MKFILHEQLATHAPGMTLNKGPARRTQNTHTQTHTRDEHSCPECDSNPRPQRSSCFGRTPPGSAFHGFSVLNTSFIQKISSVCEYCRCSAAVTMVRMRAEFVDSVARHGRSLQTYLLDNLGICLCALRECG